MGRAIRGVCVERRSRARPGYWQPRSPIRTWPKTARPGPRSLGTSDGRRCSAEVDAGRLDGAAARAVLAAAGHVVGRRPHLVAGLTAREAEVLELLVRGLANKQIAARLSVTPRTVATHIEHIFTKTGVSTRGGAAMFALRHGLVDPGGISAEQPM